VVDVLEDRGVPVPVRCGGAVAGAAIWERVLLRARCMDVPEGVV
jgi:hypothetical protein